MIDGSLRVAAHLVRRTQQIHDALFSSGIDDLTSPQFAALLVIDKQPKIESMRLAEAVGYDIATLGGLVNRLLAKKYIRRTIGTHDRRTRLISITARGKAALEAALPRAIEVDERLLSALPEKDRELFVALLERIVESGPALLNERLEESA
jgi:DNA-binding MarR family transcriptional regulator